MLHLISIKEADYSLYYSAALDYFKELNPSFSPTQSWNNYINFHFKDPEYSTREYLGIYNNMKLIGFIILEKHDQSLSATKRWVISHMFINKEYRSQGFGGMAFDKILDYAKINKVEEIEIDVMLNNKNAQLFWEGKCSFERHSIKLRKSVK